MSYSQKIKILTALTKIIAKTLTAEKIWKYWLETTSCPEQLKGSEKEWNWNRIKDYTFEKQYVKLDKLKSWVGNWNPSKKMIESHEEEQANYYATLDDSTTPPIIVIEEKPNTFRIVDGNHRARAAFLQGDTTIIAYVGKPKRPIK
jgi:hypothetical protein